MGSQGKSRRKLGLAKRRELDVAAAVARDEVMQFHVASALRLIELAAGRVSAGRMVDIYVRLHGLAGAHGEVLMYSVLAVIGQRSVNAARASLVVEDEESLPRDARSLLRILRGRLRGRVHHDLRRAVELATGAAQVRLLEIHVKHALRFARELAETHGISQAAELYSVMTDVPDVMRPLLYAHVLERLAAEELNLHTPAPQPVPRFGSFHRQRHKKAV